MFPAPDTIRVTSKHFNAAPVGQMVITLRKQIEALLSDSEGQTNDD
jgi:hypothetical protein